jgi:hypothetical protein
MHSTLPDCRARPEHQRSCRAAARRLASCIPMRDRLTQHSTEGQNVGTGAPDYLMVDAMRKPPHFDTHTRHRPFAELHALNVGFQDMPPLPVPPPAVAPAATAALQRGIIVSIAPGTRSTHWCPSLLPTCPLAKELSHPDKPLTFCSAVALLKCLDKERQVTGDNGDSK